MFLTIILWIIFIGSALLLSGVILLQEPKGGGLAEAFGGMGAQTFGVKSTGINKFTAYVAIVFLLTAVLITVTNKGDTVADLDGPAPLEQGVEGFTAPSDQGAGENTQGHSGSLPVGNPSGGGSKEGN